LRDAQKCARVEAAKEMLRILQESETDDFDGTAKGGKSRFQYTKVSSKMFAVRQQMSFRRRDRQLTRKKL
jgi:hypothetical protein